MSLTHDVIVKIREEQKPAITAEWLTIIRFGPEGRRLRPGFKNHDNHDDRPFQLSVTIA